MTSATTMAGSDSAAANGRKKKENGGTDESKNKIKGSKGGDVKDDGEKDETRHDDDATKGRSTTTTTFESTTPMPSMSLVLLICWIVPILLLSIYSRNAANILIPTVDTSRPLAGDIRKPVSIDLSKIKKTKKQQQQMMSKKKPSPSVSPSSRPSSSTTTKQREKKTTTKTKSSPQPSNHPTDYQGVLNTIDKRNRKWKTASAPTITVKPSSSSSSSSTPKSNNKPKKTSRSSSSHSDHDSTHFDPQRAQLDAQIENLREKHQDDPKNVWHALHLADALRARDLKYHDGGMGQQEALAAYQLAIDATLAKRQKLQQDGEPTNLANSGTVTSVRQELTLDYAEKSIDGLLCAMYTNMGKLYFMANMFERAVQVYSECLEQIEPLYLDAMGSRGSARIILGHYAEAAQDYITVMEHDQERYFNDAFTGLAKILAAKEEVVPQGWEPMITTATELITLYSQNIQVLQDNNDNHNQEAKKMLADMLNRLHHVLFTYHDAKTKNVEEAWHHLTTGYSYKMAVIPPFNVAMERQKLSGIKQVFHKNFWPDGIGSQTLKDPIFIIGFVRSGSTLLERVLDAHSLIVGTGEDSVFNGRLDSIRNAIVKTSLGGSDKLHQVVNEMAESVVEDMRSRWESIQEQQNSDNALQSNDGKQNKTSTSSYSSKPLRLADKMLTNYFNVGFIHMLFPKALILHVARNPMDTLWSAYKHEFPPGGLDYTSDFDSLAQMYKSYRTIMKHWDDVLPGRITHVRYEDLVNNMPGTARAIIEATDLIWEDGVLDFHRKKHAVNTLSTTQVRKGIYKHGVNAWKKYEEHLKPLVKKVGQYATWDLKTSLDIAAPVPTEPGKKEEESEPSQNTATASM